MNNGKDIYIVGGGPSLKKFNFERLKNKTTIATNMAIFDVPEADYFITVDYTFLKKMGSLTGKFLSNKSSKFFIVNLANNYLKESNGNITDNRFNWVYDLSLFDIIIKSRQACGFGFSFNDFRSGTNSGYCAIQLAILMGYTRIHLLGIDLTVRVRTHYHRKYRNNPKFARALNTHVSYFISGIEQLKTSGVELISRSDISLLNKTIEHIPLDSSL